MPLLPAQYTPLKTHIAANTNQVQHGGASVAINTIPNDPDGNAAIAAWYSALDPTPLNGWDSAVPIDLILNGLNYANFTPNDTPAQATEVAGQTWENRAMLVQIKQINLQVMLQGRQTFDATRGNNRTGLQDATENLPTGNNGNNRAGGWLNIQPNLSRSMRRIEFVLRNAGSGGDGTKATPYTLVFEGSVSGGDIQLARDLG